MSTYHDPNAPIRQAIRRLIASCRSLDARIRDARRSGNDGLARDLGIIRVVQEENIIARWHLRMPGAGPSRNRDLVLKHLGPVYL
jgi:hypothetical protein